MIIVEKNEILAIVEKEKELFLLGIIIEPKDEVEMKIIRNIFSYSSGTKKKIDRIETLAKIKVESVKYIKETGFLRIKGKILEVEKEVTKGYHAENIKIGTKLKIFKENLDNVKLILERKDLIKVENIKVDFNKLEIQNLEELAEFGILESLFICFELFFEKKELIKTCLAKKTKVIINKDKEFCEKIKLAGRRRF
ncbi:MAG: hypothetical protein QXQ14_01420 [Candidatus Aenigmatarchaeota archaeon]